MDDAAAAKALADSLAARLRALRAARDLTQADIASAAGITRNHYQLLESGRAPTGGPANPRLSTLLALARVHDTTVEELLSPPD